MPGDAVHTRARPMFPTMMETVMALQFLGKDPNSPDGGSPTLWQDTETGDVVVQGWKITDESVALEIGDIPDHETVVRIPARMLAFLPEVTRDGRAAH